MNSDENKQTSETDTAKNPGNPAIAQPDPPGSDPSMSAIPKPEPSTEKPCENGRNTRALETIQSQLKKLEDTVERLDGLFNEKLVYDETKEKALKYLDTQLEEYKKDLIFQLRRPLFFAFFDLYDAVDSYHTQSTFSGTSETAHFLKSLEEQILEILDGEGITILQKDGAPLATFDRKYHQVIQIQETPRKEDDYRVAKILKHGFVQGDKVVRMEKVVVYRFKEAKI